MDLRNKQFAQALWHGMRRYAAGASKHNVLCNPSNKTHCVLAHRPHTVAHRARALAQTACCG
eukprot:2796886-Alexandrium_andersonii.AAC.1